MTTPTTLHNLFRTLIPVPCWIETESPEQTADLLVMLHLTNYWTGNDLRWPNTIGPLAVLDGAVFKPNDKVLLLTTTAIHIDPTHVVRRSPEPRGKRGEQNYPGPIWSAHDVAALIRSALTHTSDRGVDYADPKAVAEAEASPSMIDYYIKRITKVGASPIRSVRSIIAQLDELLAPSPPANATP